MGQCNQCGQQEYRKNHPARNNEDDSVSHEANHRTVKPEPDENRDRKQRRDNHLPLVNFWFRHECVETQCERRPKGQEQQHIICKDSDQLLVPARQVQENLLIMPSPPHREGRNDRRTWRARVQAGA